MQTDAHHLFIIRRGILELQQLPLLIYYCYTLLMKLIIGLGNPGEEYQNTRHNIGFMALDQIARQAEAKFKLEPKLNAEVVKTRFLDMPMILAKPQTFVNKSGEAAKKIKLFYKVKNEDIIIVHDDLDIDFGNSKLSFGKSSGGHRGVESIISALKTQEFWRLKIGVANRKLTIARDQKNLKAKKESVGDFVLSPPTPAEQTELKKILNEAIAKLGHIL